VNYIDDHKQVFGVEPICRVLSEHGMPIAPSTYYEAHGPQGLAATQPGEHPHRALHGAPADAGAGPGRRSSGQEETHHDR
jgi:hypothetical protein